jgi:hypothetical protein
MFLPCPKRVLEIKHLPMSRYWSQYNEEKERRNTYSTTAYQSWDGVGGEYGGVDEDRGYPS